ncbi:hypothetical protein ABFV55_27780, partial [Pseudomonas syringae]|uniref:hypothetical protein n=1 Tax=Pseudomonas syringae TaxID=317 RepID=UPI0034D96975
IKIEERTMSVTRASQTFSVFSEQQIKIFQKEHKFIHIGLLQVAVRPLTRRGLNTSILICVRDQRHKSFNDSTLGMVQSSLSEGP